MTQDTSSTPETTSSPLKRALIVAGVVVFVAWGSKLYHDQKRAIEGPDPVSVAELLSSIHDRSTSTEFSAPTLPDLLFGRPCPVAPTTRKGFSAIGFTAWSELIPEEVQEVEYELLLRVSSERFTWIARRDSDCDGIYEVHTLHAPRGSGGDRSDDVVLQNLGE